MGDPVVEPDIDWGAMGIDDFDMRPDVVRAYEKAVTFRDEDQAAGDAESRIRKELRDRYDVEV